MPADYIYWHPTAEIDSDESISSIYPTSYIDPWDLENYIYIREHLDPREFASSQSSLEDNVETNQYYTPINRRYSRKHERVFESLIDSEYSGTAKYAEIEDVYKEIQLNTNYTPVPEKFRKYGVESLGLEPYIPYNSISTNRSPSTAIYDTTRKYCPHHHHHSREEAVKRRMSYSYGDFEYNNSPQSLYTKLEGRRSESERPSPIYDDIQINRIGKPNNFGLSTYGHLQIDYSCSWNNLDKYIYN